MGLLVNFVEGCNINEQVSQSHDGHLHYKHIVMPQQLNQAT
jgi:hypothetical protein